MVDAAISESIFNMLEGCVPEFTEQGYDRPPSGSTISGETARQAVQACGVTCSSSVPCTLPCLAANQQHIRHSCV